MLEYLTFFNTERSVTFKYNFFLWRIN